MIAVLMGELKKNGEIIERKRRVKTESQYLKVMDSYIFKLT